ncbi:MAG: glycosyltransferase family 4 protein [Betaproteobacteria bacterium]|nr:glycosyltransferase family 4 protein [Betaproteobacteria bacterium]
MKLPRVLVVHNRYQSEGGEDAVVADEAALLRDRGHAVHLYVRDNRELRNMSALDAFTQAVWARRTAADLKRIVGAFRPDVVHLHNTFALVSSSAQWTAAAAGIPVVQTLHNFRLLCVQAMFLHAGRLCEDCLGRVPWRGVLRRCYHDSARQSAALAAMLGVHRALGTYRNKVTRYIALTEFCRRKFIAGGLPAAKIVVKPNFVDADPPPDEPRSGALFVGRLAPEKGLGTLLAALDELPGFTLEVIGDGPERARVAAHPRVRLLGWRSPQEVRERMARAAYLVMPSVWYENFPRTLVEAFACGLPVIASRLGALLELVDHGFTGLLAEPGSARELARQIRWAETFPEKMRRMGEHARAIYEVEFTPRVNYERLVAIYADAIAATRMRAAG